MALSKAHEFGFDIVGCLWTRNLANAVAAQAARGAAVAVDRKLLRQGSLNPDESIVLVITGDGLKTIGALQGRIVENALIRPKLDDFEEQFLSAAATTAV